MSESHIIVGAEGGLGKKIQNLFPALNSSNIHRSISEINFSYNYLIYLLLLGNKVI